MRFTHAVTKRIVTIAVFCGLAHAGPIPASAQSPTVTDIFTFDAPDGMNTPQQYQGSGPVPPGRLVQASDGNFYGTTAYTVNDGSAGHPIGGGATFFRMTPSGKVTTLYHFAGGSPLSGVMLASDGNLYGTTDYGGVNGCGSIFKITTAGVVTVIYSFPGSGGYVYPNCLIQGANGSLYGTTYLGGSGGYGTVFTIHQGTLSTLHAFGSATGDGQYPVTLIQGADGSLYGATQRGGTNGYGSLFKITTAGAFTLLHSFAGNPDGAIPGQGGLAQGADGNLYGTTLSGGAHYFGTVFKITSTGAMTVLYSFAASGDGLQPTALIQGADGNLYGTSQNGGGNGSIFKVTTTGAFTHLYSFPGSGLYGDPQVFALTQGADGSLYGTSAGGGKAGVGSLFKISTSGALTTLYSFSAPDGLFPYWVTLTPASDHFLYGTTNQYGAYGYGTVFKVSDAGDLTTIHSFKGGADGALPFWTLVQGTDGSLYGTTSSGGANNFGAVYKMTTGGALSTLYSFPTRDYGYPNGVLVQASDGALYGTTWYGGSSGGSVYKLTASGAFTILHTFDSSAEGSLSTALMQAADGNLYGTLQYQGANGAGSVFKITSAGVLTILHAFTGGADGNLPLGALIQATDGNLYGTTSYGGASGDGTVYRITTGGSLTTIHAFNGTDGSFGYYGLGGLYQAPDGLLYGTTGEGGSQNQGTVYRITTTGVFTLLHSFNGSDGSEPASGLVQGYDGNLYGTTIFGGALGGTVFRLSGLYPVPEITSISPNTVDAGYPAFTLSVKGSSFQPWSLVEWKGKPLATTFVSATEVQAAVPASLVAVAGKASVTVVTGAGGGTSNSKPFAILVTTLKLPSVTLTKNSATGAYTATISLKNAGYLSAQNVFLTKASLGAASTSTTLPVSLGTIAAGATASTSLSFPGSAGTSGTVVTLKVSGTFTGGKFAGSLKVTLP